MPEKRQRVLDVIKQTGYQPNIVAKNLRTKKTNTIGVMVEDVMSFSTPGIVDGLYEYMENTDYHILLNDLRMMDSLFNKYDQVVNQKVKIHRVLSYLNYGTKVDAIIYIGMFDRDITGILEDINKPMVIAYSVSRDDHTCFVTYENEAICAQVARYLIAEGHRNIAVITGLAHTAPAQLRFNGFKGALDEAGIPLHSHFIKNGNWERESGYHCMKELLENEVKPTAVFAMNDLMAIGAMEAIHDAGLSIPNDISVIGFDNQAVSDFVSPRLTTVEIDLKAIGFSAAQMVIEQLESKERHTGNRKIIVPSKMIHRSTVKNLIV